MKKFLVLISLVALAGCGVGKDDSNQNKAQIRQNKLVDDLYGPLIGTYNGKVTGTNHGDEDVQLVIDVIGESTTNPDGTPGTKKVPIAALRRVNPVVADYSLSPSGYRPETGDLTFQFTGTAELASITGKMNGKHYTGVIHGRNSSLGNIDVTWVSADTSTDDTIKDRLLRAYRAVEGVYVGKIHSASSNKAAIPVEIDLSAVVNGNTAQLIGFYKRLDVPSGVVDLPLSVSYEPDDNPPQISMNGRGGGKYQIDMNGTLVNHHLEVSVQSLYEGYMGVLQADRVSGGTPNPGGDDLQKLQEIAGTYKGTGKSGKSVVVFTLELTVDSRGTKPVLSATLTRDDKSFDLMMATATYNKSKSTLLVTAKPADGGTITLNGSINSKGQYNAKITTPKKGEVFGQVMFTRTN